MSSKKTAKESSPGEAIYKDVDFSDEDSDIECELCEKSFGNVKSYEQHLQGKKHNQMLKKRALSEKYRPTGKSKTSDEEKNDSDDSQELKCDVCQKPFSGIQSYVAHIKSEVHAKNVRKQQLSENLSNLPGIFFNDQTKEKDDVKELLQKTFASCPTCKKSFTGPEGLQQHLKSHKHDKKTKVKKIMDERKAGEAKEAGDSDDESFAKCDVCQKTFTGFVSYETHMNSSVHRKRVLWVKTLDEIKDQYSMDPDTSHFVCNECKKPFPDPFAFKLHLDNNSHSKQKAKGEIFDFVSANPDIVAVKSILNNQSEDAGNEEDAYPSGFYFLVCQLCHMSFSGPENAKAHVKSKKHMKISEEKKNRQLLKEKMKNTTGSEVTNGVEEKTKSLLTAKPTQRGEESDENEDFEVL